MLIAHQHQTDRSDNSHHFNSCKNYQHEVCYIQTFKHKTQIFNDVSY